MHTKRSSLHICIFLSFCLFTVEVYRICFCFFTSVPRDWLGRAINIFRMMRFISSWKFLDSVNLLPSTVCAVCIWLRVGIWREGADGTDVNACCRSHNQQLLASADDFGCVNLYEYPSSQPRVLYLLSTCLSECVLMGVATIECWDCVHPPSAT